jgi:hypothetical protein
MVFVELGAHIGDYMLLAAQFTAVVLVAGRAWGLEGAAASLVLGAFFEVFVLGWHLPWRARAES